METSKVDQRLRVAFLSLPQRNQAVLEYFFASTGSGSFALTSEQDAEAAIFDFDNLDSRHHWEAFSAQNNKPAILLSVMAHPIPMTVWVQKPVAPATMLEAATKIRAGQWFVAEAASEVAPTSASAETAVPVTAPAQLETPKVAVAEAAEPPAVAAPAAKPEAVKEPVKTPAADAPEGPSLLASKAAPESTVAQVKAPPVVRSPKLSTPARAASSQEDQQGLWSWLWCAIFGKSKKPVRTAAETPVQGTATKASTEAESLVVAEAESEVVAQAATVAESSVAPSAQSASEVATIATNVPEEVPAAPVALEVPAQALAPVLVSKEVVADETDAKATASAVSPEPAPPVVEKPKASAREMAQAPRFCGEHEDVPDADIPHAKDLFYSYGDHLISALREAYLVGAKWRSPTRLDLEFGAVTYVPKENCMYMDFPEETLMAELPIPQPRRYKVRMVGVQEFADMQEHLAKAARLERFDAILWRLALETAKGRLPAGTDVNKELFLKSWPNMTRFQPTPHAMRIAALWATRGASLLEAARILEIPQRYVFAFYNAAFSTDLVTDDGTRVKRAARRGHKNSGAFSRLFNWLRG